MCAAEAIDTTVRTASRRAGRARCGPVGRMPDCMRPHSIGGAEARRKSVVEMRLEWGRRRRRSAPVSRALCRLRCALRSYSVEAIGIAKARRKPVVETRLEGGRRRLRSAGRAGRAARGGLANQIIEADCRHERRRRHIRGAARARAERARGQARSALPHRLGGRARRLARADGALGADPHFARAIAFQAVPRAEGLRYGHGVVRGLQLHLGHV